jgi:hypothetical protein
MSRPAPPRTRHARPPKRSPATKNRFTRRESDIAQIKAEMTTKTFVLTAMLIQTFAPLGGTAALIRLLH